MPELQPQAEQTIEVKQPTEQTALTAHYHNVPVDIFRAFDMQLGDYDGKTIEKLKAISDWAFSDERSLGDGLLKLKNLQIQLGSPRLTETGYDKIYNWVKLQNQINELRKRQEAV